MNTRYIKSIIATAEATDVKMPWARGKRRQQFIAKRIQHEKRDLKTA